MLFRVKTKPISNFSTSCIMTVFCQVRAPLTKTIHHGLNKWRFMTTQHVALNIHKQKSYAKLYRVPGKTVAFMKNFENCFEEGCYNLRIICSFFVELWLKQIHLGVLVIFDSLLLLTTKWYSSDINCNENLRIFFRIKYPPIPLIKKKRQKQ